MGEDTSPFGHAAAIRSNLKMAREGTIHELEDWVRNGAQWRPAEIYPDRAVVDLCSCTGELMDRVESGDPEFVAFVRTRRDE